MATSPTIAQANNNNNNNSLSDLDHSFTSRSSSTSSSTTTTFTNNQSSPRTTLPLHPLPHHRLSPHWSALLTFSTISLRHLKLLRHIGSGHLARVFHCHLRSFPHLDFALKVVDLDSSPTALSHAQSESRVLALLDHPFLPTLYARFLASHFACFLIDYCPNGDLHSLLRRSTNHRLPITAVKFYAAEILLALEYLHALGFVYRDLKPENVLLRADGHVMLADFDLCFYSQVSPSLHRRNGEETEVEFVAEPKSGSSSACVGTHEYLPPEIVCGERHGSAVDWWAFGVFVYELIYGRTPFKGGTKEGTLKNILVGEVRFPDGGNWKEVKARDLILRLLERDVRRRMGSEKGAAEIKRHEFFDGVNWALVRMMKPPAVVVGLPERKKDLWWKGKWWNRCNCKRNDKSVVCGEKVNEVKGK